MNTTFAKSVDAFVASMNKGVSAFGTLLTYANACIDGKKDSEAVAVLKNTITADELAYRMAHPKLTEMPVTYRSSKSVVLKAVGLGVSLMDEDGKPKGKSALEKECKELATDGKTPAQKFAIAMNTATAVFAGVDTLEDVRKCKALMAVLAESIVKAEAALVAAASESK